MNVHASASACAYMFQQTFFSVCVTACVLTSVNVCVSACFCLTRMYVCMHVRMHACVGVHRYTRRRSAGVPECMN